MTPITWFLLADTIVTSAALVLAALAWWRVGGYMQQCRCTVQAYASIAERHDSDDERYSPLLADRITEDTQEIDPVDPVDDEPTGCSSCGAIDDDHVCGDPHPTGRHALPPPLTQVMPATGDLDDLDDPDIVRPYVRATTVPRYAFGGEVR